MISIDFYLPFHIYLTMLWRSHVLAGVDSLVLWKIKSSVFQSRLQTSYTGNPHSDILNAFSLQILGWLVQNLYQLRPTAMKLWRYGTDRQMSYWDQQSILHRLTCGKLVHLSDLLCIPFCFTVRKLQCSDIYPVVGCFYYGNKSLGNAYGSCILISLIYYRGVGCIMYEMISGRPLFPGATVEDELHLIFRTLGTPTEDNWPGIRNNEEFSQYSFNTHNGEPLLARAPRLGHDSALGLLSKFLLVRYLSKYYGRCVQNGLDLSCRGKLTSLHIGGR